MSAAALAVGQLLVAACVSRESNQNSSNRLKRSPQERMDEAAVQACRV
jgi:hypothetical protein